MRAFRGSDCIEGSGKDRRTALEQPAIEGESPVVETVSQLAGSRVPRDTWNLAGKREDHLLRLNTT